MSQHNTPINHTPVGGGSPSTVSLATNTQGIEPLSFQEIILRAKKSMVVNVINDFESTFSIKDIHNYVVLLNDAAKENL